MQSIPHASDPGDRGPGIIAGTVVVAVLATIAVGLRVISRRLHGLSLEVDDYLIFAALPFSLALCVSTLIAVKYGLGRHADTLSQNQIANEARAFLATEILWVAPIPMIKISILLLYMRIFGRLRYFKVIAYIIGIFSICWAIMAIMVASLQCRPIQYIWDKSIEGTCIDTTLFFKLGSAPNVLTDFVLLVLPLPAVWSLQTTTAQKLSLTATFLLGSLTCIISFVRLIQLLTMPTSDLTWSLSEVAIWSAAEPNLGIVSACMPTMKPLLLRLTGQGKTRRARSGRRSGSSISPTRFPLATSSFGPSNPNRIKFGQAQEWLREMEDDMSDNPFDGGQAATRTYITGGEVAGEKLAIPCNAITVQTNMDWQLASRDDFRRNS